MITPMSRDNFPFAADNPEARRQDQREKPNLRAMLTPSLAIALSVRGQLSIDPLQ